MTNKLNFQKHEIYSKLCKNVYHSQTLRVLNSYTIYRHVNNPESGFQAEVYCKGNEFVIVYCGTNDNKDKMNDFAMLKGHVPKQLGDALKLYNDINELKKKNPNINIVLIGHSLGGSLAQMVAALKNAVAVTFEAYGTGHIFPNINRNNSNIINYGSMQDYIFMTNLSNQIGKVRILEQHGINAHKIENYCNLEYSFEIDKNTVQPIINDDFLRYIEKNNQHERYKNITTGYAADVYDIDKSSQRAIESEYYNKTGKHYPIIMPSSNELYGDKCSGSYPVSGYTRSDGRIFGRVTARSA